MQQHGVRVNDLCGFVGPRVAELQLPKNVHFNAKGSEALAGEVAKAVTEALAAKGIGE
jgi:lysophospholipase L1-like esterase